MKGLFLGLRIIHTNLLEPVRVWIGSILAKNMNGLQMIRHKYNAVRTTVDDIGFGSKKEAARYCELKLLKESGEVVLFLMQVPFRLPGKVKYLCDFQVFWSNGEVTFEDVKGVRTAMFILKRKQVEELYAPVKIKEV